MYLLKSERSKIMKTYLQFNERLAEDRNAQAFHTNVLVTSVISKLTDSAYAGKDWHSMRIIRKYIPDRNVRKNQPYSLSIIVAALEELRRTFYVFYSKSSKGNPSEDFDPKLLKGSLKGYVAIFPRREPFNPYCD